ncbi:glycosyltransferase [Bacteroidota bacterium]
MREIKRNKVLVAPLNWGLGHVSRCIPIVNFLIENNYEPVIASDGDALVFFRKEFPSLESVELPSYGIRYSKKEYGLKLRLFASFFFIRKAVQQENLFVEKFVNVDEYVGIISDNRFGVYHSNIPSVYVTHQLKVFSGITTKITSIFHQKIIAKFDECWVPDIDEENNLGGELSQSSNSISIPIKFIGNLSRLTLKKLPKMFDLLVLLSGPEPQRSLLENKLLLVLENYQGKIAFVRGVVSPTHQIEDLPNRKVFDFLMSKELETIINQSDMVVCRSGYSSLMDLKKLEKKAFFIPTPGQTEQEYLAKTMKEKNIADFCTQSDFNLSKITASNSFTGFSNSNTSVLNKELLALFK